ncbi:MAG: hypothetical protein ACK46Q_15325, partial [Hyphomonas sp.]
GTGRPPAEKSQLIAHILCTPPWHPSFFVDVETGIASLPVDRSDDMPTPAGFESDPRVRFYTGMLAVTLELEPLGSITSIPLMEIRG